MDWLRNWKKRMFFSVAVGMAVAVIFSGAPKNVEDSGIMAWWGTLYPQFCFEDTHTAADNYENTVNSRQSCPSGLRKRWRGGKMLNNRSEMQGVSEPINLKQNRRTGEIDL